MHDELDHFGANKTYAVLCFSYYWLNMRCDLVKGYILSCVDSQHKKSSTKRPAGPLHPLPVPESRFGSMTLNFVSPLPPDKGFDQFCFMTCHAGVDVQISPCYSSQTGEEFAHIFFCDWYCETDFCMKLSWIEIHYLYQPFGEL